MEEDGGLWFGVLGPLEVRRGGSRIPVTSRMQRLLLARLLVEDGPVSEDALVDALWGDHPPPSAMSSLRAHLSRLRAALSAPDADCLGHGPGGYRLTGDFSVDARSFEDTCAAARRAAERDDLERAHSLFREALSTWRGEPFADLRFEPFAQPWIARLEGARLQAQEDRIDLHLRIGRPADVVSELEELVRRHPFREGLVELLMLALDAAGRRSDALEVYRRAGEVQRRELGLDPSPALQRLHRQILQGRARGPAPGVTAVEPVVGRPADPAAEAWRQLLDSLPVPEIGDGLRADLLLARGEGLRLAGRVDEARRVFAAAARVAFAGDRPEQIATAVLGLIGPPEDSLMDLPLDEGLVERAMIRLPAEHRALPLLRARLAVALLDRGEHVRGRELLQTSLDVAEAAGDHRAAAYALRARHRVWFDPDQLPARLASSRRLLALGTENDRPDIAAWGHRWCAIGLLEAGEVDQVAGHLDALERLADVQGDAFHRWFAITRRAGVRLLRERGDSADSAVMEAVSLTDQVRSEYTTFTAMVLLWASHYLAERWDELLQLATVLASANPTATALLPLARAKCGELGPARDAFCDLAGQGFEAILAPDRIGVMRLLGLTVMAETAATVGADEHGRELYELLSPYAGRLAVVPPGVTAVATVDHALGRVAALVGDPTRARRHYEDALALCSRGGTPVLADETERALATLA